MKPSTLIYFLYSFASFVFFVIVATGKLLVECYGDQLASVLSKRFVFQLKIEANKKRPDFDKE